MLTKIEVRTGADVHLLSLLLSAGYLKARGNIARILNFASTLEGPAIIDACFTGAAIRRSNGLSSKRKLSSCALLWGPLIVMWRIALLRVAI